MYRIYIFFSLFFRCYNNIMWLNIWSVKLKHILRTTSEAFNLSVYLCHQQKVKIIYYHVAFSNNAIGLYLITSGAMGTADQVLICRRMNIKSTELEGK